MFAGHPSAKSEARNALFAIPVRQRVRRAEPITESRLWELSRAKLLHEGELNNMNVETSVRAQQLYALAYAKCLREKIDAYDTKLDEAVYEDDTAETRISIDIDERIRQDLINQWERITGRVLSPRGLP